jgi:hypothetical protein
LKASFLRSGRCAANVRGENAARPGSFQANLGNRQI